MLATIIGAAVGELLGVHMHGLNKSHASAKAKLLPFALERKDNHQHIVGQLLLTLESVLATGGQVDVSDFATRMQAWWGKMGGVGRTASPRIAAFSMHPLYTTDPIAVAKEVGDTLPACSEALAHALAAGLLWAEDSSAAAAHAATLAQCTHGDYSSEGCAVSLAATVAQLVRADGGDGGAEAVKNLSLTSFQLACNRLDDDQALMLHCSLYPDEGVKELRLGVPHSSGEFSKAAGAGFTALLHDENKTDERLHFPENEVGLWASRDAAAMNATSSSPSITTMAPLTFTIADDDNGVDSLAQIDNQMAIWQSKLMAQAEALMAETAGPVAKTKKRGQTNDAVQVDLSKVFMTTLGDIAAEGGDARSNCAVAGAMLGARYGIACIPEEWRLCVQAQMGAFEGVVEKVLARA
jgi:ADP-ribosylglycohydrolase